MANEFIGRYLNVGKTRIYYEACGSGLPMFCIHTAGACSLEYRHFAPIMADNGLRAIAVDLPGHGKSDPVDWKPIRNMHEYGEFVWKVIEAVCQGEKPIVIGCSIGGDMTVELACHHSKDMRAGIALEGAAFTPTVPPAIGEYASLHANPSWHDQIDRGVEMSCYQPHSKEMLTALQWTHHYAHPMMGVADLQCWATHDVRDKLKDIKCPVLVVAGEADFFVPEIFVDETVAAIPGGLGEKLIAQKVGHYPMFEQPQYTADFVLSFLRRRNII